MIVNSSSVRSPIQPAGQAQNHRQPQLVSALRWFWRFSNFYGEYQSRSLRDRQCWVNEQSVNEQIVNEQIAR